MRDFLKGLYQETFCMADGNNVFELRRTRDYYGRRIPSAERTVVEDCGHEGDKAHVHLIGFATQRENSAEYEMVLGEEIVRHIVAIFRQAGVKL
jgi:hypothetical protein